MHVQYRQREASYKCSVQEFWDVTNEGFGAIPTLRVYRLSLVCNQMFARMSHTIWTNRIVEQAFTRVLLQYIIMSESSNGYSFTMSPKTAYANIFEQVPGAFLAVWHDFVPDGGTFWLLKKYMTTSIRSIFTVSCSRLILIG